MVFYRVISATFEVLSDYGPLILVLVVLNVQNELLFERPIVLLDARVQMIVPAFTTLFSDAARQVVRYVCPFLGSISLHEGEYELVFFFGPGAFNELRVENFLPSMEALYICPAVKALGNLLPVFTVVFLDCTCQLLVFEGRPVALIFATLVLCGSGFIDAWVVFLSRDYHLLCCCQEVLLSWASV